MISYIDEEVRYREWLSNTSPCTDNDAETKNDQCSEPTLEGGQCEDDKRHGCHRELSSQGFLRDHLHILVDILLMLQSLQLERCRHSITQWTQTGHRALFVSRVGSTNALCYGMHSTNPS